MALLVLIVALLVIMMFGGAHFFWRNHAMKNLAQDVGLRYSAGEQSLSLSWYGLYYVLNIFRRQAERHINIIDGAINGHVVKIFDVYFAPLSATATESRFTFIEIDNHKADGEGGNKSIAFGENYLVSVAQIRNMLSKL